MLVKVTNALSLWVRQRTFQFFIYYPNLDNQEQNRSLINYKSHIVIRGSRPSRHRLAAGAATFAEDFRRKSKIFIL